MDVLPCPFRKLSTDSQGQRVNATYQFPAKRFMNGAVSLDSAHGSERARRNLHQKVAFTTFPVTCVPSVFFAFVSDLQQVRLKCLP